MCKKKSREIMIRRTISLIGILCISTLLFTEANAKGKPDKPNPSSSEQIIFSGDLVGDEIVEGCCPNAGPFPAYMMYLSSAFGDLAGWHDGNLFINNYGAGKNHQYIVQFWVDESFGIEIIGGVIEVDRKTKYLRVTFTDEECFDIDTGAYIATVSFVLQRFPAD